MDNKTIQLTSLEQFAESVHEGILIFHVEYRNYNNNLKFANTSSREIIKSYGDINIESLTIESLFDLTSNDLRMFIREKLSGNKLQEERVLHLSTIGVGDVYTVGYHIFSVETGFLLELFIRETSKHDYSEDIKTLEKGLDDIAFSEGYIAVLVLRNFESIVKHYGDGAKKIIRKIMIEEIETIFKGQYAFYTAENSCIVAISRKDDDMLVRWRQIIDMVQNRVFEDGINILCVFNAGISSYCNNKYVGFREAKFSLHELYSKNDDVGQFVKQNDKTMMEYVIKHDLPHAIEHNELNVVFQGIYDIRESSLYGLEVLIRWNHSKYGNISPAEFIPIAENSEVITELDLWVAKQALMEFDALDLPRKNMLKLNLNISPRDFMSPIFADRMIETIENSTIKFTNVILELTETLNLYPGKGSIQKLKDKGIMFALDDFGTGFSSLSQIKHYEIDFLKIDISFVRDINKNYNNTLITNAILSLAKNLDISVIAEGVESVEQVNFLKSRRCEYVQGFKYHRPMSRDDLEQSSDVLMFINDENDLDYGMEYKEYVGYYQYGKLIYVMVNDEGEIKLSSDLLERTLHYEIREGENIKSLVINSLSKTFDKHMETVLETGLQRSFMTELVGLKESVPVKATLMKNEENVDVFLEDYRDRREIYERTKNIYNRYDLIFRKVNTAIIVTDTSLVIQEWNHQAEQIFGYTRVEAVGKNIIKLIVDDKVHDAVDKIANQTLMGDETESLNDNIRKDGNNIICKWKNNRLEDDEGEVIGIISWVMDLTEQLRVEEELNILSTVMKQEPDPIVITDTEGHIEFVNHAFTQVTGYNALEVIGENPRILSSGFQSTEYYKEMWETLMAGQVWEGVFKNKKKNGETYITSSRIFPVKNDKGIITRYSCIQKDITSEVEKDNRIKEINNTLETQERMSMIGQMAAGIMHEINNPLAYIDVNVQVLPDMLNDIDASEDNAEIVGELRELSKDLIEGIDSIKTIAAGLKRFIFRSQSTEFEKVDLNEEIDTISTISKNEYKYYCEMDIEKGNIPFVMGDAGKIKQVLLNLVINAVHAIKEKDSIDHGQIKIKTYVEGDYVCCDITDNGKGIEVEIRDKIFESFFTTKEEGMGTGLGLSLSKKIIETEHKGILGLQSELGLGTTFTIKLKSANLI